MLKMKKIGALVLALGVMAGFTQAVAKEEKTAETTPDATLTLKGGSVAAGIGFSWGSGTLTYKGKEYKLKVNGLSIGKVGITSATAAGKVYNLKKLSDFNGHYSTGGVGATVGGGRGKIALKNSNDVRVLITSTTRGVDVTAAGAGVDMQVKK